MATFTGTSASETITPGFVSPTVTVSPPGSVPGDAADTINGKGGNDTMAGGGGNDTYDMDSAGDVIIEGAGKGYDRVNASVSATLAANVESLFLFGTAASGTGNDLGNVIQGNSNANSLSGLAGNDSLYGYDGNDSLNGGTGNDIMSGGGGNDTMAGGTGDDTYVVDNAGDVVTEAAGAGTDKVKAYDVNYTLGDNVENLYLYGTATDGTGNDLPNEIYGTSNANTLSGLGGIDKLYGYDGNDTLNGGDGNDTLDGGAGNDNFLFRYSGSANSDTIADFSHTDDTILLEDLLDQSNDLAIQGLEFLNGVLKSGWYFESPGDKGNGVGSSGIFNDTMTGNIYYNPTTGVAGDAVVICTVGGSSTLNETDFMYSA